MGKNQRSTTRIARRFIVTTLKDARMFDLRLRELWPDIRYVSKNDWAVRDDKLVNRPRPPERTDVPYVDGLGDARAWRLQIWREPEGWEPVWLPHEDEGIFIANKPRLRFHLDLSFFRPMHPGLPERPFSILEEGWIWAQWHRDDKEHEAFFRKVLYEMRKMFSNVLVVKGDPEQKPVRTSLWVGPHALEWARLAPDHSIGGDFVAPPLTAVDRAPTRKRPSRKTARQA